MTDRLRIGVIGAGRIGRVHAANIARLVPRAELVSVADVIGEAARSCAQELGAEAAAPDDLLADSEVDAVVICSSTDTHASYIEAAAAAGKHIFCEKPISLDLDAIDRALAAVDKAGVKLQVGFNRRFDANFRRVRQAVVDGDIGEVHLLHLISRDPSPPPIDYVKRSGGLFVDMTIHDFDMARFLTGSEVVEIYAAAAVRVDPAIGEAGDVDTALITLRFENGAIGSIDNSRRAVYGYDQRAEVFGSRGSIRTENNHSNSALISTSDHVRRDLPLNFFIERYADSYIEEIRAFTEAVLHDEQVPVTGADGRVPVQIAQAAQESLIQNRPIPLPRP